MSVAVLVISSPQKIKIEKFHLLTLGDEVQRFAVRGS